MVQVGVTSSEEGPTFTGTIRRWLATIVVVVSCLTWIHAPLIIEAVVIAGTLLIEAFVLRGSRDRALYARGLSLAEPLPASSKRTLLTLYGVAAAIPVVLPLFRALPASSGDSAGLVVLAIVSLLGAWGGVWVTALRRYSLKEILDQFELMVDVLLIIELAPPKIRAFLSSSVRMAIGTLLMTPLVMMCGRTAWLSLNLPIAIISISLGAAFQLGMLLLSQALLGFRWMGRARSS